MQIIFVTMLNILDIVYFYCYTSLVTNPTP